VEGKFDAEFFKEALRHVRLRRPIRIVDLPALDGDIGGGGIERMRSYIKDNASAIASRRAGAPVVAVLDWDAAGKLGQFSKLVARPEVYKAFAWHEQRANPRAGKSFKGIERFHNNRVLDLAIQRDAPIGQKKNGELTVAAAEYDRAKAIIARIVQEGLKESDLKYAMDFVIEVAKAAEAL